MEDVHTQFVPNIIFILGKFYIHKCKCLKTKPLFSVFQKEFWMYCKSVRLLKCKTGRRLLSLLHKFKLLEDPREMVGHLVAKNLIYCPS